MNEDAVKLHAAMRTFTDFAQSGRNAHEFLVDSTAVLQSVLGFDNAVMLRRSRAPQLMGHEADSTLLNHVAHAARVGLERYATELVPVLEESHRTGVLLDTTFESSPLRNRQSRYYREVIEPTGARSMLEICPRWNGRILAHLFMYRYGKEHFRIEDRDKAARILPVFESSFVACAYAARVKHCRHHLTDREWEVARGVARGFTNSQIGIMLGTSLHTVRNRLAQIFQKLNIESRAELAVFASNPLLEE